MILIDTNVVSEMMRPSPDHNVVRWLDSRPVSDVWVSAITKAEIYLGIAILPDGKRKTMILDLADQMFHDDFLNGVSLLIQMQHAIMQISWQSEKKWNGPSVLRMRK